MEKLSVTSVTPKKLKLSDYELGQTLGTGILISFNFKVHLVVLK